MGRAIRILGSLPIGERAGLPIQAGGLVLAGLALVGGIVLTPPPGGTATAGLAGVPRFALYILSALSLALTARAPRLLPGTSTERGEPPSSADGTLSGPPRLSYQDSPRRRAWLAVLVAVVLALSLAAWNGVRLSRSIDDPLGPALWLASMVPFGYLLLPGARRLGWPARWSPSLVDSQTDSPGAPGRRSRLVGWASLFVVAIALRLVALGSIPNGIHSDEGDRAAVALKVLGGTAPMSWFDSGWYYISMVYFRTLAVAMAAFGTDVGGTRVLSAVVGSGLVLVIAAIGWRHFGWRVALAATSLAVASALDLQASRFIAEAGPMTLLWGISILAIFEGGRTGRPWAFAVAGLSGALSVYYYPAARLWPFGAAVSLAAFWLFARGEVRAGILRGSLVVLVAAAVAATPMLVHLQQHPDEATLRYEQTTALSPENQRRLSYVEPGIGLPKLLVLQTERAVGMLDRYPDGGTFLPDQRPALPQPVAGLAIVGILYALLRSPRDPRLMVLSIWFWLGLSGVLLTVETPSYLRGLGILPTLPIIIGLVLVDAVDSGIAVARAALGTRLRWQWQPSRSAALVLGLVAVAVIATDSLYYFGTYSPPVPAWGLVTREGQQVAELGKLGPVYSLEASEHMVDSGWVSFLAPDAQRGRVANPGQQLPLLPDARLGVLPTAPKSSDSLPLPGSDSSLTFLVYPDPNQAAYLDLLKTLYPGGTFLSPIDGRSAYQLSRTALQQTRGVTAQVGTGGAAAVSRFGEVPASVNFPSPVEWRAGIRLSQTGPLRLRLTTDCTASLSIDDVRVLGAAPASGATAVAEVVLDAPRGLHLVRLRGEACSSASRVVLERAEISAQGGGNKYGELAAEDTYRLMDAPWGLSGRLASGGGADSSNPTSLSDRFLDATIATGFPNRYVGIRRPPYQIEWSGSLIASRPGAYRMAFASDGEVSMWIDDRPVSIRTVKPEGWRDVGLGTAVELSAGSHRVRVMLVGTSGDRSVVRWNWVPPTSGGSVDQAGAWSVVPPMVLRPDAPTRVVDAGNPSVAGR